MNAKTKEQRRLLAAGASRELHPPVATPMSRRALYETKRSILKKLADRMNRSDWMADIG